MLNLPVDKFVDGKKIIDSGTLLIYKNNCDIVVSGFRFEFQFIDEPNGVKNWIHEVVPNDPNRLIIKLFNFDNIYGEGNFAPIRSAIINGYYVYITYSVSTLDKSNQVRVLNYNILLGEPLG